MKKAIFDFANYRDYLESYIQSQPNEGRGFRSSLAKALQCQNSHITQILGGQIEISLERADLLNRFMNHTPEESEYLILQVEHARAGTPSLKKYFAQKISEIKKKRELLGNRITLEETIGPEQKKRYYGSWVYAAIHMIVGIPGFQTLPAIAKYLGISEIIAQDVIEDLVRMQLLTAEGHQFKIGSKRIYLTADSPLIAQHHSNWRMRSLLSLQANTQQNLRDLHFSSVVSVSKKDFLEIKEDLMVLLEKILKEKVSPSPEETLVSLNLDWFEVKSG